MASNDSLSKIRASKACIYCNEHGTTISVTNHSCPNNNDEHKETCKKCRTLTENNDFSGERASINMINQIPLEDEDEQQELQASPENVHEDEEMFLIDNLIPGTIEKRTGEWTSMSSFGILTTFNYLTFAIFVIGYPIIKMNEENWNQIKEYLEYGPYGSEFLQIQYNIFNNGMFIISCIDEITAKIVVNVINNLAFRFMNGSTKYPLVITQFWTSSSILMTCLIDKSLSFEKFMKIFAKQNKLNTSFWRYNTSMTINAQKQKMSFFVDITTYDDFLRKGKMMKFNGEQLKVNEEENYFNHDMKSLTTMIKNDNINGFVSGTGRFSDSDEFTIRNGDLTWNGFRNEIVNDALSNCKNIKHFVLIGSGTGSFYHSYDISFEIETMESPMITFHWYIGIKNRRDSLPNNQLRLKELTIHKLPFDFDGGKILKYIIEEINLEKFDFGKIPLILNGEKQDVKKFEANEIQIQSTYEMFRQFPNIESFRLNLSTTDIASDEIENIINPPTNLFESLNEFEVVDSSKYRQMFGVFLGLFKNMKNLRKLTLKTQDRNINTLLGEFLHYMPNLNEIYLTSAAPRGKERLNLIKSFVPNLRKLSVAPQFIEDAKITFGSSVEIGDEL